ncbi:hypothetical protein D3C73_886000 [compost metagenome]
MSFIPGTLFFQGDKPTGPTFYAEIEAFGGLMGQHWTRHTPGIEGAIITLEFFEDTPPDVVDGVLAVYEAHDPTKAGIG